MKKGIIAALLLAIMGFTSISTANAADRRDHRRYHHRMHHDRGHYGHDRDHGYNRY